jgi:hypothetical protein
VFGKLLAEKSYWTTTHLSFAGRQRGRYRITISTPTEHHSHAAHACYGPNVEVASKRLFSAERAGDRKPVKPRTSTE